MRYCHLIQPGHQEIVTLYGTLYTDGGVRRKRRQPSAKIYRLKINIIGSCHDENLAQKARKLMRSFRPHWRDLSAKKRERGTGGGRPRGKKTSLFPSFLSLLWIMVIVHCRELIFYCWCIYHTRHQQQQKIFLSASQVRYCHLIQPGHQEIVTLYGTLYTDGGVRRKRSNPLQRSID